MRFLVIAIAAATISTAALAGSGAIAGLTASNSVILTSAQPVAAPGIVALLGACLVIAGLVARRRSMPLI